MFTKTVYPSDEFHANYESHKPILYTAAVVLVFFCTTMVFVLYDIFVQRRQQKVMGTAMKTTAIVQSLFPKEVTKRLMAEAEEKVKEEPKNEPELYHRKAEKLLTQAWRKRKTKRNEQHLIVESSK